MKKNRFLIISILLLSAAMTMISCAKGRSYDTIRLIRHSVEFNSDGGVSFVAATGDFSLGGLLFKGLEGNWIDVKDAGRKYDKDTKELYPQHDWILAERFVDDAGSVFVKITVDPNISGKVRSCSVSMGRGDYHDSILVTQGCD